MLDADELRRERDAKIAEIRKEYRRKIAALRPPEAARSAVKTNPLIDEAKRLRAAGKSYRAIARELALSVSTVTFYVKRPHTPGLPARAHNMLTFLLQRDQNDPQPLDPEKVSRMVSRKTLLDAPNMGPPTIDAIEDWLNGAGYELMETGGVSYQSRPEPNFVVTPLGSRPR